MLARDFLAPRREVDVNLGLAHPPSRLPRSLHIHDR